MTALITQSYHKVSQEGSSGGLATRILSLSRKLSLAAGSNPHNALFLGDLSTLLIKRL